jgi:PhoPQ-activated pathogenicity-related protein
LWCRVLQKEGGYLVDGAIDDTRVVAIAPMVIDMLNSVCKKTPCSKSLIRKRQRQGFHPDSYRNESNAVFVFFLQRLNMPVTLNHQKQLYGEYSKEVDDYVKLEIPQAITSPFGKAVVQMIDPYSYRDKQTIPKMIIFGTNDPYWTIDAVKHYINDIPRNNAGY